jgi:HEAT repeat protein
MAMTRRRVVLMLVGITLAGLVIAFFSHPYGRQLVLGPKIRGAPLWAWQQEFRSWVDSEEDGLLTKSLAWLGIKKSERHRSWQSGDPDMLPLLLSLADDPSSAVRRQVAYELGFFPDSEDAVAGIIRFLHDAAPEVREQAVLDFCDPKLPSDAVLPRLRELMDDSSEICQVHAAFAVWHATRKRDEKVVLVLRQGLRANDLFARGDAALALAQMGKDAPECFEEIAEIAKTDGQVASYFAAGAPGYGAKAVPLLIAFLDDGRDYVRARAVRSLGKMGPDAKAAVPALVRCLDDPDQDMRRIAAAALSKIEPERYPQKKEP